MQPLNYPITNNNQLEATCTKVIRKKNTEINLVEEEIRVEVIRSEELRAAGAIALVLEVSDDTHVAETMTTRSEERILNDLHANRAEDVLIRVLLHLRARRRGRGGGIRRLGLDGRHESAPNRSGLGSHLAKEDRATFGGEASMYRRGIELGRKGRRGGNDECV